MMNQERFKDVLMITKMLTKDDDKGDDKKLKGQSKNEFKIFKIESRTLQDSRGKLISRIKNQDSKDQDFKNQDSRIKRRLNQDKYEKVFSKIE